VITLVKPQYEAPREWLRGGVLPGDRLEDVLETCRTDVRELGWQIVSETRSPLAGHGGNVERLGLLRIE
jgi:predicted rRNA methylase YqxC with S4 and FtsJ domains